MNNYKLLAVKDCGNGQCESAPLTQFGQNGFDYYGVYEIQDDGFSLHLADFNKDGKQITLGAQITFTKLTERL